MHAAGSAYPDAQTSVAVNSLGLLDLVQIAAVGLAPKTQYQVYLAVEYFSVDCERHWFPSSNNKDASHSGSDFPSMVIRPPSHTREAHEGGHEGEKDSSWFLRMAKWTNLVVWSYTRANSGSAKRVAGGCEIAELRRTESAASRLSASCSNPAISARTSSCRIPSSS